MKNSYAILVALFIVATTFAQVPEQMRYQAIVRNATGSLVTNQQVGMQISILQTTVDGTAVYVETQTPITNANGLVSIAIGTGTPVNGTFATIDWSADTYFIKTETDPTGSTSYSIIGTSQLLSVPYALHAKTVATAITAANGIPAGGTQDQVLQIVAGVPTWIDATYSVFYKDTDGDSYGDINSIIATSGAAPNGYVTNNTDCNDGDATINPGQGKIYGDGIDNNCDGAIDEPYAIGDFTASGVVFYIASPPVDLDGDGDLDNGLVAAIANQSATIQWYNGQYIETGATGIAIGTGASNTNAIIAAQGATETAYAAGLARAYRGGGFNDWFLPSKDELNEMYTNKAKIDQTATANGGANISYDYYYWSSTENDSLSAWRQYFNAGFQGVNTDKDKRNIVRAVRAF
jgi:hypothetical protein